MDQIRGRGLKLNWNDPEETLMETWLSRGDRRLAEVIYEAWKLGVRFDAWQEEPSYDRWLAAFEKVGLDPTFYTHRPRPVDERLPWDHISTTVRKKFLADDYAWSMEGKTRVDCRFQCFACGILPTFSKIRTDNPGDVWQCPDVTPKETRRRNRNGGNTTIPVEEIEIV